MSAQTQNVKNETLSERDAVEAARAEYDKAVAEPLAVFEAAVADAVAKARAIYERAISVPSDAFEKAVAEIVAKAEADRRKDDAETIALAKAKVESEKEAQAAYDNAKADSLAILKKATAENIAVKAVTDAQSRINPM